MENSLYFQRIIVDRDHANCYFLHDGSSVAWIDPGDNANKLIKVIFYRYLMIYYL